MSPYTLLFIVIAVLCTLLASAASVELSDNFCVVWDRKCEGNNLTKKPKRIKLSDRCLKKCSQRDNCLGADYWELEDGKPQCVFKSALCSSDQLVEAEGARSFIRLSLAETECPEGSLPSDADRPTAAPTEPPAPTPDPCRFAYDKCTCISSLQEQANTQIADGEIFLLESKCGSYKFRNFPLGAKACRDVGAQIATRGQLDEALAAGAERCSCGWLARGTAAFPMQKSRSVRCGNSKQVNVCHPKMRGRKDGPGWNVWCVRAKQ